MTPERTTSEALSGRAEAPLRARLARLTAEVDRLSADRDRLDWLDANARGFSWGGASAAATVRDAIDAARKMVLPADLADAADEIERLRADRRALTFAAFAAANRARCEAPDGFNHRLDSWSLSDWFTAAMGELGEAANVAKKLNRVRDGVPGNTETEADLRAKLRLEIADACIYLDLLAQSQGFTLEAAVREAFDAKSAKIGYPKRLDKEADRA